MNAEPTTETTAKAPPRKFDLGQVVSTPGALETFSRSVMLDALARHMNGDWSEMDPEDQEVNRQATFSGARILSSFTYDGKRLWIITDGDDSDGIRHCTTFLLPNEY
jgi:hypothetical protein